MAKSGGTSRNKQHGGILLGIAGGLLLVAGGFGVSYYVLGAKSEASIPS